jgi:hypothetical protein
MRRQQKDQRDDQRVQTVVAEKQRGEAGRRGESDPEQQTQITSRCWQCELVGRHLLFLSSDGSRNV